MSAFVVGEESFICVGLGGKITATGDGWVEIAGQRLPTRLEAGAAIRYISTEIPDDHSNCGGGACIDCREYQDQMDRESLRWSQIVRTEHDDNHADAWVHCRNRLCMEVQR